MSGQNTTILIIDDSKVARQQVLGILKQTDIFSQFLEASDGLEGFKTMVSQKVDVVLCDLEMPGIDGFKFLQMIKGREEFQSIPVIMLTGREDQDAKIRGLGLGASDYVTKPFDPGELLARVKVQLKIKTLQDKLIESNLMLKEMASTDPLTGLANRRIMMETLRREFGRCSRGDQPLSLIMVDADHFKRVNDTYGHQQGDVVLNALADLLRKHLRPYDLAARFGGEEFAVILPETPMSEAVKVAERLRSGAQSLLFDNELKNLQVTISLGVSTSPTPRIHSEEDMIREADNALYKAKQNGRNRTEQSA